MVQSNTTVFYPVATFAVEVDHHEAINTYIHTHTYTLTLQLTSKYPDIWLDRHSF